MMKLIINIFLLIIFISTAVFIMREVKINSNDISLLEETKHTPCEILVTCEECGCAILSPYAVKGESVIEEVEFLAFYIIIRKIREERIREVYYCKACATKPKKKQEKK